MNYQLLFISKVNNNRRIRTKNMHISQPDIGHSTINSKINGTPKGVYLPISKQHSILVIENLLAF